MNKTNVVNKDEYNIVCPFCNTVNAKMLRPEQDKQLVKCNYCNKDFYTEIFVVRSKRSKIIKDSMGLESREFNIRVISLNGEEGLINFINYNAIDLELKSKDIITIIYDHNNQIRVVGNQTINYHLKIGKGTFQKGVTQFKEITCGILSIIILVIVIKLFSC
jgi:hypothetical protein